MERFLCGAGASGREGGKESFRPGASLQCLADTGKSESVHEGFFLAHRGERRPCFFRMCGGFFAKGERLAAFCSLSGRRTGKRG